MDLILLKKYLILDEDRIIRDKSRLNWNKSFYMSYSKGLAIRTFNF